MTALRAGRRDFHGATRPGRRDDSAFACTTRAPRDVWSPRVPVVVGGAGFRRDGRRRLLPPSTHETVRGTGHDERRARCRRAVALPTACAPPAWRCPRAAAAASSCRSARRELGTNDAKTHQWNAAAYEADYLEMASTFLALEVSSAAIAAAATFHTRPPRIGSPSLSAGDRPGAPLSRREERARDVGLPRDACSSRRRPRATKKHRNRCERARSHHPPLPSPLSRRAHRVGIDPRNDPRVTTRRVASVRAPAAARTLRARPAAALFRRRVRDRPGGCERRAAPARAGDRCRAWPARRGASPIQCRGVEAASSAASKLRLAWRLPRRRRQWRRS